MQKTGGTRAANVYSAATFDNDFLNANTYNKAGTSLLTSRNDTGMAITLASFPLRDQVRTANSLAIPLQFTYDAADFRMYYTMDNVFNMSRLWRDVAAAVWDGDSLCVPDSTGYATKGTAAAVHPPPKVTAVEPELPSLEYGYDVEEWPTRGNPKPKQQP